jgi:hypothetical protein
MEYFSGLVVENHRQAGPLVDVPCNRVSPIYVIGRWVAPPVGDRSSTNSNVCVSRVCGSTMLHRSRVLIPHLLMMAMHLCGVTENINIGCGFNIVPMWHPLRLAEDYAMADILTGGRVIFGVGRGYHTREVKTLSSPLIDQNANREMFEEGVEVLCKAFAGKPFSQSG